MCPWPGDPKSQAVVWQVKDDCNGIIEIKGETSENKEYRFFVFFHKDQVGEVLFVQERLQLIVSYHLTSAMQKASCRL